MGNSQSKLLADRLVDGRNQPSIKQKSRKILWISQKRAIFTLLFLLHLQTSLFRLTDKL